MARQRARCRAGWCGDRNGPERLPEIVFKGLRANYRTWGPEGAARPIVLLHAGGGSGALWQKVAEAMPPDRHAIAPDLLSCGDTEAWPVAGALTHDLQAGLVAEIIDKVVGGPAAIVGHSYGGATAVRLAIDRPEKVRSLLLIEPILTCLLRETGDPLFEESVRGNRAFVASVEKGDPEAAWELFLDARNGAGTWARLSAERRRVFLAQSSTTCDAALSNLNNRTTLAECRAIRTPMTIACGEKTTATDRRTSEVLRDATGARYEIIAGAGHMSPLSHPHPIVRLIEKC
jgi:lipase